MTTVTQRFSLLAVRSHVYQHWPAALAVGMLLASTSIGFWPTFGDEQILMGWVAMSSWDQLLTQTHIAYPHYPPYYVVVKLWGTVAPVETVRFFSVACSIATVLLTYRIALGNFSRRTAGLAAILLALSPVFAIQSHWIRPYPLLGLVITAAWWTILTDDVRSYRWPAWAALSIATIWVHLFGIAFVAGMVAYQLLRRDIHLTAFVVVGLNALASLLLIFGRLLPSESVQAGSADLSHINAPPELLDMVLTPGVLMVGGILTPVHYFIGAGVSGLILAALIRHRHYAVVCWAVVPIFAVAIGSHVAPVFQLKYFSVIIPALAIVVAHDLEQRVGYHATAMLSLILTTQIVVRVLELTASNMGAIWIAQYLHRPW